MVEQKNKSVDEKFCESCGNTIKIATEICPSCGARQNNTQGKGDKSKTTAGLLALFLGGIGAHKFYLGQPGMGLLYLFFCWTFIPGAVAFVEAIMLFAMDDTKFNNKY